MSISFPLPLYDAYLLHHRSKKLWIALCRAYGGPYAFAMFLKLSQDCLAFLQPQLLRLLLSYVSAYQYARENEELGGPEPPSPMQGFLIAGTMFITAVIQTIILHQVYLSNTLIIRFAHILLSVLPTLF